MFSGIVERACPLLGVLPGEGGRRLVVDLGPLRSQEGGPGPGRGPLVGLGDSVAIQGVCLTVAALAGDEAAFDVVPETLGRSNLGTLEAGAAVNVERSLRYGDRVDGHLVQGHVERTGQVVAVERPAGEVRLTVDCGPGFTRWVLPKGSVALDGVSLTVARLEGDRITVALVPHTLERTTLGRLEVGTLVNLEPDMIGQWVQQTLAAQGIGQDP